MVSLIARLCAFCAVCSLIQLAMPEGMRSGIRMIGGLLMLHLVISDVRHMAERLLKTDELMHVYEILMR